MRLIESEVARWHRDGFLHLPNLLSPVARERIRRWVVSANGGEGMDALTPNVRGLSTRSASFLASHHTGLSRLLKRGLMPEIAGQLLGAPARPSDIPTDPTHRQLTCVVALHGDQDEPYEVMAGRHLGPDVHPLETWQGIPLEAGDLLWVHGLTPRRGRPSQALLLEYRALDTQTTFGWSEHDHRAHA